MNPVQVNEQILTKEYYSPAKEYYYQPITQRKIVNTKEEVEFVPTENQIITLNPVSEEPIMREAERVQTIVKPGSETYRETYIQPLIQKDNVKLNVLRGDDQNIQLNPISEVPKLDHRISQKVIDIEGKEIVTQPILEEYYL